MPQTLLEQKSISPTVISSCQPAQQNSDLSDEEKIKATIEAYFTLRYEGQKNIEAQDFSALVEDNTLDWVKKEKDKREIELYIASLSNLGYQSYKFTLDYDFFEIKGNEAFIQLRENHQVIFNAIAPTISTMANLKHTFTLQKKKDNWIISKDEYQDELSQALDSTSKVDIKKQVDENYQLDVIRQKQNPSSPTGTPELSAASTAYGYNGAEAAFYANSYITGNPDCPLCGYNTTYYITDYVNGDCANFVSQALYAGGGKKAPNTSGMTNASNRNYNTDWYYVFNNSGSKPWIQVEAQKIFITTNTYNNKIGPYGYQTSNLCSTKAGDIVQLFGATNITPKIWDHEGLIVSANCSSLYTLVNAHSTDHYNYPLSYWNPFPWRYIVISGYNTNQMPVFTDVSPTYWAWDDIERLYSNNITAGCVSSPLLYCPGSSVTRAQMAVFLLKSKHGSSYIPPAVGNSTGFSDVPVGYWADKWIKQLAAEGITSGCAIGYYCPESAVTHAQMAIFLLKSKYGSSYTPPAVGGSTNFRDVTIYYWAAAYVKQIGVEGISYGAHMCGFGIYYYCPDNSVTRAEMAGMLLRAFSLP